MTEEYINTQLEHVTKQFTTDMNNLVIEFFNSIGVDILKESYEQRKYCENLLYDNGVEEFRYKGEVILRVHPYEINNVENGVKATRKVEEVWKMNLDSKLLRFLATMYSHHKDFTVDDLMKVGLILKRPNTVLTKEQGNAILLKVMEEIRNGNVH